MDASNNQRKVAGGAFVSGLAVMGSRLMGLLREQLFAFFFGASREYDAFLTAFRIPNLLRDLLAEGALSSAFVTTFSKEMHTHGKQRAFDVANTVMSVLAVFLTGVVLLGMWQAEGLVRLLASGFDADKVALTALLTQIMFPFIVCVAMAALAMGMLNAQHFYALPQSASTFFNITSMGVGLLMACVLAPDYMWALWKHAPPPVSSGMAARAMVGMSIGTLTGGLVQWWVQMPQLFKTGYALRWSWDVHDPAFKKILRLMGPALLGASAVQLNVFVNSNFASMLGDKPISWLNYAFRLMQFPIGVFGVAIVTAALPSLSKHLAAHNHKGFGEGLTQALEWVLLLTLPSAVGLAVLSEPVMRMIYEHGRFTHLDTFATSAALSAYALGLPGYAVLKVVQPAFVALEKPKVPMYVALAGVLLNASCNAFLILYMGWGHVALALSTALMALLNAAVLVVWLECTLPSLHRTHLWAQTLKILLASGCMGALGYVLHAYCVQHGWAQGAFHAALELALSIPLCVALYAGVCFFLRVESCVQVLRYVAQKSGMRRRP